MGLVGIGPGPSGKPAPDPYLAAADRLGVSPWDCIVIEDAAARDVLAGGMQCIDSNLTKAAMLINAAKVHAILALAEAVAGGRDHHT
jgi:beta-phosphoglucomutase-like phosphatase (HAD superfamily)